MELPGKCVGYWRHRRAERTRLDVNKRLKEKQIIGFLCEAEMGLLVAELCRRHGFAEATCNLWRNKFGGMSVSDAKRLKELELENTRLKRLLIESMLENEVTLQRNGSDVFLQQRLHARPSGSRGFNT